MTPGDQLGFDLVYGGLGYSQAHFYGVYFGPSWRVYPGVYSSGARPLVKYLFRHEQISSQEPVKNLRSTKLDGSNRGVSRISIVGGLRFR